MSLHLTPFWGRFCTLFYASGKNFFIFFVAAQMLLETF